MQAFVWDARYETGIERIDAQHQRLVDLINALGDVLLSGDRATCREVFGQVRAYARVHFADEEALMSEYGLPRSLIEPHRQKHRNFVTQLEQLWAGGALEGERAQGLHGFLVSWLVCHILGEDQEIAKAISPDRTGATLPPVSERETVLLDAVRQLYQALSLANADLAALNHGLEETVVRRSAALLEAQRAAETTRQQLLQSEKMASLGQLAAGLAHEINNPIGFISSNLTSLRGYVEDLLVMLDTYRQHEARSTHDTAALTQLRRVWQERDIDYLRSDVFKLLDETSHGLHRVARIVRDLKDFSQVDQPGRQMNDLHAGIDSTLNMLRVQYPREIDIRREYGVLPLLPCDLGQINQVFFHLLRNAMQAIGTSGRIVIRSGCNAGGKAEDCAWVEIDDDGGGIAPQDQAHIFEPFFTTRPVGQGRGLGLSLSWGIVHQHGGRLEFFNLPAGGTRFRVTLPLAESGKGR